LEDEMLYGEEWRYETIDNLRRAIHLWIKYYNNERMMVLLKTYPKKYIAKLAFARIIYR
jgi:hypothetical protein